VKLRGISYVFIAIMLIMAVVIISSLLMEEYESRLLPLLIGALIFILSGIGLWHESRPGNEPKTITMDDDDAVITTAAEWRAYMVNGAWIIGFLLAIWLLGFIVSVATFVPAYMKWMGTRWTVAIFSALIVPLFVYFAFERALEIDLYRGIIITWLFQ